MILPAFEYPALEFRSQPKPMSLSDLDASELVLFVVNEKDDTDILSALPHGNVLKEMREHIATDTTLDAVLPNKAHTRVLVAKIDPKAPTIKLLTTARKLIEQALKYRYVRLDINLSAFDVNGGQRVAEALCAATAAAIAPQPQFKKEQDPLPVVRTVCVHGCDINLPTQQLLAEAEGAGLARYLAAAPANAVTPETLREHAEELADANGWIYTFHGMEKLQQLDCGAFTAVAKGAAEIDSGIVHLTYRPEGESQGHIALVGKGLCMDTGGYNLKISGGMLGMHLDMTGAAVALGSLLALSRVNAPYTIDCWLAVTENHISPAAYRNNDVVTAANGVTIEIIDTDAEGRMVLADTLVLACNHEPQLVVDYATLTGACMRALGSGMSGVFTNRQELLTALVEQGDACGERVWGFPLLEDYDEHIKSDVADVKQCAPGQSTDHIDAALFLNRFVAKDIPWVHMDLSSGHHKGGLAHVGTDVTGFGVRYTLHALTEGGALHNVL